MNRRQKIIVSVVGIFIVLLALVGLTYAYFLTQVKGNTNNKSISVTTANLRLVYGGDDGSIIGDNEIIEPDKTFAPKTFTVSNEGNEKIDSYAVVIENFGVYYNEDSTVINENNVEVPVYANDVTTLARPQDFEIVITCKNQDGEECTGYSGALPTESAIMLTNSIEKEEVQTYTATLTYKEAGTNQSADMNKRIEGKFNIIGLSDTIDLTGTVTSYQKGDYVQTNSTKRVSAINPDGTYKVLGLEAGKHKIKVCAADPLHPEVKDCADEDAKLIQEINIVKGETASGNNSTKTITITEDSRLATVNIDATEKNITIEEEVSKYNPFAKGTLAYAILNDNEVTEPKTIPGKGGSGYKYIESISENKILNKNSERQDDLYVYADSYTFDKESGTFILNNPQIGVYSEIYSDLDGKYVNEYYGYDSDPNGGAWTVESLTEQYINNNYHDRIYKITTATKEETNTISYVEIKRTAENFAEALLASAEDNYTATTGKPSYYFRGAVENNYVNYSGMCWRIVRIDGKGNIKLILADDKGECNSSTYSKDNKTSALINGQDYEIYNVGGRQIFEGFKGDAIEEIFTAWSKYNEKPLDSSEIVTDALWCNDISYKEYNDNQGASYYRYGAHNRLYNRLIAAPTLKCDMKGDNNSSAVLYEGPIGLITADELTFAGFAYNISSNSYISTNAEGIPLFTMTPQHKHSQWSEDIVMSPYNNTLSILNIDGNEGNDIRPVILIKNSAKLSTNTTSTQIGTQSNPYVID